MGKPSSGGGTQQTVNKTELPEWVSQAGQRNLNQSYDVSQNLMGPYTGQRVADLVPGQMAAIAGMNRLPGSTTAAFNLAQDQAANVGNFQAGQVTPTMLNGLDLSGYMNPFTNSVIGTGLAGLDVQRQQALRQIGDQALASRAFGGSRQGIQEGVTNTGAVTAAGNLASQLAYQNFNQAQQAATGDISRDLAAQQFNEQARQQAAQTQLAGANALGGLASQGQQTQLQALMAMLQGNQLVQGQNQAMLDAARQQYAEQQNFPIQQLQIPLQALGMTPYGQTQTQTSPTPPGNATMSGMGMASAGLGILGALMAIPTGGTSLMAALPALASAGAAATGAASRSDRRLKTDIEPAGHDPNLDLPLYAYRYKRDPKTYPKVVGVMAQDVEKKYPEAVGQTPDGFKTVNLDFLRNVANLNALYARS